MGKSKMSALNCKCKTVFGAAVVDRNSVSRREGSKNSDSERALCVEDAEPDDVCCSVMSSGGRRAVKGLVDVVLLLLSMTGAGEIDGDLDRSGCECELECD